MDKKEEKERYICIRHGLFASLIVALMFLGVLIINRIIPFGDNTFLMYDMKRQYVDFYSYLRTLITGENNVFYSFSTALGSGMMGFFTYYLSSPVLFILLFFPEDYLPIGILLVILIKLLFAAFIMDVFLQRKLYSSRVEVSLSKDSILIWLGSATWAMSGFLFAHSMNTMWIDVVSMLPLVVLMLERVINENKKTGFVICIAYILWCNYYISYQILIFVVMWTIFTLVITKNQHPFKTILRVFLTAMLGILIDGLTLVPTAFELADSPKDIVKMGLELTGSNLVFRDVFSKLASFSYDYIEARFGYPQVFCGVAFILLGIIYFFISKYPLRERIGMAVMLFIMLISFCKDALNLFWHALMEPSGHPYRQAYIWVFLMILCALYALKEFGQKKTDLIWVGIAILLSGIMFWQSLRKRYDHISDLTIYASFALLVIYAVILIFMILVKDKVKIWAVYALVLLQLADITASAAYTYHFQALQNETLSDYEKTVRPTAKAVKKIKTEDDTFFRMENLNPRQQNDGMQYNYNGITHYSSAGLMYVRYFLKMIGFNDDGLFTSYGHDNTVTADSLLGLKYQLSDGTFKPHGIYYPVTEGETTVYENPYALPIAFCTKATVDGFVFDSNPLAYQENIINTLSGGNYDIFVDALVDVSDFDSEGIPAKEYDIVPQKDGELFMYLDGIEEETQGLAVYCNDEFLTAYGNASSMKIVRLGEYKKGETVCVKVLSDTDNPNYGEYVFVTEDTQKLSEAVEVIKTGGAKITRRSSSHLNIVVEGNGGLFTSIPYERGWHINVDDQTVTAVEVLDALMYIPLGEGSLHTIDMYYVPTGIEIGLVITLISIVGLIMMVIYERREKNKAL